MKKTSLELYIPAAEEDVLAFHVDKNSFPEVYKRKMYELVERSGMTEQEADNYLLKTPIILELFYDIDRGLFAVESESAAEIDIFNPYTGAPIPKEDPECCGEITFEKLKEMWDEFGDIPIDKNECIEIGFRIWPIGTDRFLIWEWFDERCPNNLHDDLMFPE